MTRNKKNAKVNKAKAHANVKALKSVKKQKKVVKKETSESESSSQEEIVQSPCPDVEEKSSSDEDSEVISHQEESQNQQPSDSDEESPEDVDITQLQGDDEQEESDEDEDSKDDQNAGDDDSDESMDELPKKVPNTKIKKPQKLQEPEPDNRNYDESSFPPSTRVFISNLPRDANDKAIGAFFSSKGLQTTDLYCPGGEGGHKGFAFAEFQDMATAEKAVKLAGQEINGTQIDITYAKPRKGVQAQNRNFQRNQSGGNETNIVFVKNLKPNVDQSVLSQHFKGFSDIRVMTNEDGSCRGHAFIEFDSADKAKTEYDRMSGQSIEGSQITLDFAQPRRGGGGGGFRQRGGFGGGDRHERNDSRGGRDFGFQRGGGRGGFRSRGGSGRGGGFGGRRGNFEHRGVGKFNRGGQSGYQNKKTLFNENDD